MFSKVLGTIIAGILIAITAVSAVGIGVMAGLLYTVLIALIHAVGGYVMGLVFVYLFPVEVAALAAWLNLTISVPLFFAGLNLASFFLEKTFNRTENDTHSKIISKILGKTETK